MSDHPIVNISFQPIELCKLLKIANMVSGGGEAKIVISEGYVALNGEVEFQKRKKVYHNDIIEFDNEIIQVVCTNTARVAPEKPEKSPKANTGKSKANNKNSAQNKSRGKNADHITPNNDFDSSAPAAPSKRRPISF